jgi:hypothetical protein
VAVRKRQAMSPQATHPPLDPRGLNVLAKNTGFRRCRNRNNRAGRLLPSLICGNSSNKSVARIRVLNAFFSNDLLNTTSYIRCNSVRVNSCGMRKAGSEVVHVHEPAR